MSEPSTAIQALHRLKRAGFEGMNIRDANGDIEAVAWVLRWRGYRDVVLIRSEDEAIGYREPISEETSPDPRYIDTDRAGVVMVSLTDVVSAVHAMLSLSHPASQFPPSPRAADRPHLDEGLL